MTNKALFDELRALKINAISAFLNENADKLLNYPILVFIEEVSKISSLLSPATQEKVDVILAYTLKEFEESVEVLEEIWFYDDNESSAF